jgi:uncharacterized protein (DUF2062 family)
LSTYWFRLRRFILHKVLHTDDTPHAIALGVAIATFVAFLPLIGIQTVVAIAVAAMFRANKAVCIPVVWITNPATAVPIYYGCFAVGRFVVPGAGGSGEQAVDRLVALTRDATIFESAFWADALRLLAEFGAELWLGCGIVGVAFGGLSYVLARWGVSGYRARRRRKLLQRSLFRSNLRQGRVIRRSEPA